MRRVVVLYPEDLDFRESLGQTLAAAGREEAAQVELDEAARLRSGGTVDPSLGPFVGSREFPGKLVWVKVLPDGRVFQRRLAPDDQVFKSEGVLTLGDAAGAAGPLWAGWDMTTVRHIAWSPDGSRLAFLTDAATFRCRFPGQRPVIRSSCSG